MTRIGKKEERRARCPKKRKAPSVKTGPKEDLLPKGFKERSNAVEGNLSQAVFIGTISHPGNRR